MSTTAQKLSVDRVVPIFALTFVDILGLTLILPLLHLYAVSFGASPLEIGLTLAAFPLAQLIGVPVMGALSDRFGRKPLLLISQITTCISFIMLGSANSLGMVIASRLFDGLFGANLATAQAALSDITTEETRAQGLGITGAAFGLGFIIGPVISIGVLEVTDSVSMPAFVAAGYSLISILLTTFMFKETLPKSQRGQSRARPFAALGLLKRGQINVLLVLMFAQQVVFFGFESLLGLFTLSRLGMLGQGNAVIFLIVGMVLVTVQVRFIGRWVRKYGERRLVLAALALLSIGLLLLALTPEQPHPFYVQRIVINRLAQQAPLSSEYVLGDISVPLPPDGQNGIGGLLWVIAVIVPISVGAGLIRPNLNSLMTKRVGRTEFGSVLGLSTALVSLANALAPLSFAFLFQQYGATVPYLVGGLIMGLLAVIASVVIKPPAAPEEAVN